MLNRTSEDIVAIRPDEMTLKNAPIAKQDSSTRVIRCESLEALIQAVGYLKFLNKGPVYFRGQDRIYQKGMPTSSIYREDKSKLASLDCLIEWLLHKTDDSQYAKSRKKCSLPFHSVAAYALEPLMQHYGVKTRWLDLTDSLPYALFFSLAQYVNIECTKLDSNGRIILDGYDVKTGSSCISRVMRNNVVSLNARSVNPVYLIAICIDGLGRPVKGEKGITCYPHCTLLDARACIPSQYLRPHMQHALMLKMDINSFDVCGNQLEKTFIFELPRAAVLEWLGSGKMFNPSVISPPLRVPSPYSNKTNPTKVVDKGLSDLERNMLRFRTSKTTKELKDILKPLNDLTNYVTYDLLAADYERAKNEKHSLERIDWSLGS